MVASSSTKLQWIEVDATAIAHNLSVFRNLTSNRAQLVGVVKANAYGHGLEAVVSVIADRVDWFGVHSAAEARQLRDLGVRHPILVMGVVVPGDFEGLGPDDHLLVSSREALDWVAESARTRGRSPSIHLKVDCGTNRQGFELGEIDAACRHAVGRGLEIVGIATHFANIEDTLEHDFARQQLDRFHAAIDRLRFVLGTTPPWIHASCSAAALLMRDADFTMVRTGISMYGLWPSRETRLSWILEHGGAAVDLRPVATWKTVVGQIQQVGQGETVGYGRTWRALRPTRLAVLPIGYSDGYPRILGNRSRVVIGGTAVPVVGRVCMNICMADVTDLPGVGVGDEVVLMGRQGDALVTADELAAHAGTINYELVARLSPLIPRRVVTGSAGQ